MALYTETVMDHFMNPRNVGEIENPDGKTAHLVGVFIEFDIEIGGRVIKCLVDNSHIVDRHFYLAATCRKKQQEQ